MRIGMISPHVQQRRQQVIRYLKGHDHPVESITIRSALKLSVYQLHSVVGPHRYWKDGWDILRSTSGKHTRLSLRHAT